jgi:hypothetical protein
MEHRAQWGTTGNRVHFVVCAKEKSRHTLLLLLLLLTYCGPVFFLYIYHKSLIQSKVTFF